MRYIQKQQEPHSFSDWKKKYGGNGYESLSGEPKSDLKDSLIQEQQGLCCYCECKLDKNDSHIEHLRPRSKFPEQQLEYQNMLCSCQSELKKGEPQHCGMAKENWFDERLFISPLEPECGKHFLYKGNGTISPVSEADQAAKETIQKLKLNMNKLCESRKQVLEVYIDDTLSEEEYLSMTDKIKAEIAKGNPPEYVSAIQCVLGL